MLRHTALTIVVVYVFYINDAHSAQGNPQVSQNCLGCICEASSGCNLTSTCDGNMCGPFSITKPYWTDAGKPTINDESPDSSTAFNNCVRDVNCAAVAIQGYMKNYPKDCSGDVKVDCEDFVRIHMFGAYGCQGQSLPKDYRRRFEKCKAYVGDL